MSNATSYLEAESIRQSEQHLKVLKWECVRRGKSKYEGSAGRSHLVNARTAKKLVGLVGHEQASD